jgi:hypothetical protein
MPIEPYLDKLESLIDLDHVRRTRELQRAAFAFRPVDHIPTLIAYPPSEDEWPVYGFLDIFADREKMLLHELSDVYAGAKLQDDRLYGIRANYGTGIVASMFGCRTVTFEDSLPTAIPLSPEQLERILAGDVPAPSSGLASRALETAAWYREVLRPYPKLSQAVGSQMLDIQGPFDNASEVWGSSIYYDFYDAPDRVRRLIHLTTQAILGLVREHRRLDGCPLAEHDGAWHHLGGVCIRNDSSVTMGGAQYAALVRPFDVELLGACGGWVHFCGKAHQWWRKLLDIPGLKGINPYQGEFYDLPAMYDACRAAGVAIVQWTVPLDAPSRERIRTGLSRIAWAASYDAACRLKERLYATGHVDA